MSYNHHNRSQGYVPSYNSQNTGAAYMERRGWGTESDQNTTISFTSKSSNKRIYICLFLLVVLLLVAAIIIIILFATGVFSGADPLQNPVPSFRPPINGFSTQNPPIFQQNLSYLGQFVMLRQANDGLNDRNSVAYSRAFSFIQNALDNVLVTSSTLRPYAVQAQLTNLQNMGNDLLVQFRVTSLGGTDTTMIANVLQSNINALQTQLGGNAQIDFNSISIIPSFLTL